MSATVRLAKAVLLLGIFIAVKADMAIAVNHNPIIVPGTSGEGSKRIHEDIVSLGAKLIIRVPDSEPPAETEVGNDDVPMGTTVEIAKPENATILAFSPVRDSEGTMQKVKVELKLTATRTSADQGAGGSEKFDTIWYAIVRLAADGTLTYPLPGEDGGESGQQMIHKSSFASAESSHGADSSTLTVTHEFVPEEGKAYSVVVFGDGRDIYKNEDVPNPGDNDDDRYPPDGSELKSAEVLYHIALPPVEMKWEAIAGNENVEDNKKVTVVDANDNPTSREWMSGKGQRIFPDRKSYADQTPTRNRCVLHIKSAPNFTVFLKAFDIDDPTPPYQDGGPEDNSIDPEPSGDDNRGTPQTGNFVSQNGATATFTLDAEGEANVIFETTMQPGDNFRVALAFKQEDLNVLQVSNPDTQGFVPGDSDKQAQGFNGVVSPMLTVWRKLWLERDSMSAVPNGEKWRLGWIEPSSATSNDFDVSTLLRLADGEQPDEDEFEGGNISIYLGDGNGNIVQTIDRDFKVVRFQPTSTGGGSFKIYPALTAAEITAISGAVVAQIHVTDDDDYTVFDSPKYLSGGNALKRTLAGAYIEPFNADQDNTNKEVAFIRRVTKSEFLGISLLGYNLDVHRDLQNADDYWTTLVVACFEPAPGIASPLVAGDGDPDGNANGTYGWMEGRTPANDVGGSMYGLSGGNALLNSGRNFSAIFLETFRDANAVIQPPAPLLRLDMLVAHEVCHTGGSHLSKTGSLFNGFHSEGDDLMNTEPLDKKERLNPTDVTTLRGMTQW